MPRTIGKYSGTPWQYDLLIFALLVLAIAAMMFEWIHVLSFVIGCMAGIAVQRFIIYLVLK